MVQDHLLKVHMVWTINNLKQYSTVLSQICSRTRPCLECTLFQEHVCNMVLEQYAFQIWSWNIFNLEYSSRLSMIQDHMVLEQYAFQIWSWSIFNLEYSSRLSMVQDHMVLEHMIWSWTISRAQNFESDICGSHFDAADIMVGG